MITIGDSDESYGMSFIYVFELFCNGSQEGIGATGQNIATMRHRGWCFLTISSFVCFMEAYARTYQDIVML